MLWAKSASCNLLTSLHLIDQIWQLFKKLISLFTKGKQEVIYWIEKQRFFGICSNSFHWNCGLYFLPWFTISGFEMLLKYSSMFVKMQSSTVQPMRRGSSYTILPHQRPHDHLLLQIDQNNQTACNQILFRCDTFRYFTKILDSNR